MNLTKIDERIKELENRIKVLKKYDAPITDCLVRIDELEKVRIIKMSLREEIEEYLEKTKDSPYTQSSEIMYMIRVALVKFVQKNDI